MSEYGLQIGELEAQKDEKRSEITELREQLENSAVAPAASGQADPNVVRYRFEMVRLVDPSSCG